MRAFVGLPVPEGWHGPLVRAQGTIPVGRRVDPEDMHVTLAFLGDVGEERLEALSAALSGRRLRAATLRPAGYAAFGPGAPRAVALDLSAEPALAALRDAVRSAAREAGIELRRERFRPHVTLLRLGAREGRAAGAVLPGALAALGAPEMATARATAVTLWSSTLTPDGPLYDPLESWPAG